MDKRVEVDTLDTEESLNGYLAHGAGMKECTESHSCANFLLHLESPKRDLDISEIKEALQPIVDFFKSDVRAAFEKDPAANSVVEVLTSYPGIKATLIYRVAHFLWILKIPFVPRFLTDIGCQLTSIDIHPGAKIGKDFFIDHGIGVVIGETTEIGDNVTLYQGVTLGGTSTHRGKRHPTIGNNVVLGAGAMVLGLVTIGNHVRIGANSVVTRDVPDNSVVMGVPGRVISRNGEKLPLNALQRGDLPDPVVDLVRKLEDRIELLEKQIHKDE